jgi:raffinose/stachyose/melibiose transport system permease protein
MAVPAQSSGAIAVGETTRPRAQIRWVKLVPYLFILPAFILFVLMRYVPAVQAIYYSLTEWNGIRAAKFIGLENYTRLFQDQLFLDALINMAGYTILRTLIVVVMAFFAAELVFSIRSSFMQTFWKIAFIIPLVVPGSVVYLVWAFVFNTQSGILNSLLAAVGLGDLQQPWLGQSSTALWAILFIGFPFVSSFAFLIYTSSLQSLPSEVLDAARVDGCNTLRRIFYIDFPLMRGPIALTVILLVLEGIQVLTPQIVLTGGGPGTSTESPANFLYRTAFQYGKFGYATAVGVVMLLIGFIFSYFSIRMRYQGAADVDV